jgi:hypothetical protein
LKKSNKFWKFLSRFEKVIRFINDISSFLLLVLSLETVYKTKNWSVLKPWQTTQITSFIKKFPFLINTVQEIFALA